MTVLHGVIVLVALLIAIARMAAWRACRTPLGRVNYEMARARERRRL